MFVNHLIVSHFLFHPKTRYESWKNTVKYGALNLTTWDKTRDKNNLPTDRYKGQFVQRKDYPPSSHYCMLEPKDTELQSTCKIS